MTKKTARSAGKGRRTNNTTKRRPKAGTVSPGGARATSRPGFPIVALGASAGGLQALEDFFAAMPPDSGMAFVVVTHLHPGQPSMLHELLRRKTSMPVVIGRKDHDLVGAEGARLLHELKRHVLDGKGRAQHTVRLKLDGKLRVYDLNLETMLDEKGAVVGISGVQTDVTIFAKETH